MPRAPMSLRHWKVQLAAALCAFIALLFLAVWLLYRFLQRHAATQLRWGDQAFRLIESHGHNSVVAVALLSVIVSILGGLAFGLYRSKAFDPSRHGEFYWLKYTLVYLGFIGVSQFWTIAWAKRQFGSYMQRHQLYYDVSLRSLLVVSLLCIGIVLYLFKRTSKVLYGMSEIAIGVLSNLALIERADVSRFPAISMPTPDIIAVGAFTYLLSRGVSNVAEGVQEKMKQAAEASAAATAEVSSATEATTAQALAAASTVEKTASPPLAVGQTTDSGGPQ